MKFPKIAHVKKILKNKLTYLCLALLLVGLIVGLVIGYMLPRDFSDLTAPAEFHAGTADGKLINPLYECNTGQVYGQRQLSSLQSNINTYVNQITANNSVTSAAIYFRDLNNGKWFGINEHDDFAPSSLLKVPVMMAYYKQAEKDPSILSKKITYSQVPEGLIPQNFKTKNPIVLGQTYTVEQLIEKMIIASDNAALGLLEDNIDNRKIDQVTLDLGIITATSSTPDDFMDVSEYSTLFRVLYYSTYLNDQYSEKALELLSQAEFNQGLTALLPKDITIAHKFGEREVINVIHQLHDCGIIYYPNHPYLLCIMTKGPDFNDLTTTIQQISKKIYDNVVKTYH